MKLIYRLAIILIFSVLIIYYLNDGTFATSKTKQQVVIKTNKKIKYLIYECVNKHCSGWADRIKGIMTSYALSLLMDRKFLIRMTKPCQLEDYLIPNEIDWSPNNIPNLNKMKHHYLSIDWRGYINESSFSKINFIEYYKQIDVIITQINMQLIKHLTINSKHHKRIQQLGYLVNEFNLEMLIYKWFNKLFKLNAQLETEYESLIKNLKPTSESKLICAQIRIFNYKESSMVKLFWKFIQNNFIKNNEQNYKIFVTSDKAYIIDESIKVFGAEHAFGLKNNSFHINYIQKRCDYTMKLILDFKLLSMCDMAVVSHSGFGMVGLLNRVYNQNSYQNLYVHSNPDNMRKQFWNRKNLTFVPFNTSLFYLEFNKNNI